MKQDKQHVAIGGQALLEGVMMRGKHSMALAVRNQSGNILIESKRLKPKKKIARVPIIRGMIAFVNSLILGISTLTRASEVLYEDEEQLSKTSIAISVIIGAVLAIGIFFFIPGFLSDLFYNHVYKNVLVKNLFSGFIRISLFVGYLFLVSLIKDIRRTFMYHGAEHKTINCYESGSELTIKNIQAHSTRHNRCGTTFLFLVMVISILVFAVVEVLLFKFIPLEEGYARTFLFMGIKLVFLPLVAGVSYEALFGLARLSDSNPVGKILRAPGLALQKLTTKQPDDEMVEVALRAFNQVLVMDENHAIPEQKFENVEISEARQMCLKVLHELNAEECEADWLLSWVCLCKRGELSSKQYLTITEYNKLCTLLKKRKEMPLDYCLGASSFYGLDVVVDRRVLVPRMDTEAVVEKTIKIIGENRFDVLDLCTGSGCIAYALAKNTHANITAVDISDDALDVAKINLKDTNIEVLKSDLFSTLADRRFDVIVSNPPYIKSGEIDSLSMEVKCQPHIALDGGEDGLYFYRRIIDEARGYLNDSGMIVLEIGYDQALDVERILIDYGYTCIEIDKDINGNYRVVSARLYNAS